MSLLFINFGPLESIERSLHARSRQANDRSATNTVMRHTEGSGLGLGLGININLNLSLNQNLNLQYVVSLYYVFLALLSFVNKIWLERT